jgi:hypothetical protein
MFINAWIVEHEDGSCDAHFMTDDDGKIAMFETKEEIEAFRIKKNKEMEKKNGLD